MDILCGNAIEILDTLPTNSVDSIVTDPPYGLGFMDKNWDKGVPTIDIWAKCLRVLKPGGHLLAFGGTRTYHRMVVAIEDAGFEIRDMLSWVYSNGFPKGQEIGKAIDRQAGAEREVVGTYTNPNGKECSTMRTDIMGIGEYQSGERSPNFVTAPATLEAKQWDDWHTALKPAYEPIVLARKPLDKGSIANNVLKYGTGALNIGGCRIDVTGEKPYISNGKQIPSTDHMGKVLGRFPSNLIHDGSGDVLDVFPKANMSRYYYCAKANKRDRDDGCGEFPEGAIDNSVSWIGNQIPNNHNNHPTVKPTELMRWLIRLITPPNGTVLDPFMGSGSTGKACALEGFDFIGIELNNDYVNIAKARIRFVLERLTNE